MASKNWEEFQYFTAVYDFLNAIDSSDWGCFKYYDQTTGKKDVLGHYGCREFYISPEGMKLAHAFKKYNLNIVNVNDGFDSNFAQTTPKERVIAAINQIRVLIYPAFSL